MADKINKNRHRLSRVFKRALALFIIVIINFNSFSAVVSSNDGSAFITKAEFDALVNDFNSRIEDYEKSIDAKIDGAIAEYLAGLATSSSVNLKCLIENLSYDDRTFKNATWNSYNAGNVVAGDAGIQINRVRGNYTSSYLNPEPTYSTYLRAILTVGAGSSFATVNNYSSYLTRGWWTEVAYNSDYDFYYVSKKYQTRELMHYRATNGLYEMGGFYSVDWDESLDTTDTLLTNRNEDPAPVVKNYQLRIVGENVEYVSSLTATYTNGSRDVNYSGNLQSQCFNQLPTTKYWFLDGDNYNVFTNDIDFNMNTNFHRRNATIYKKEANSLEMSSYKDFTLNSTAAVIRTNSTKKRQLDLTEIKNNTLSIIAGEPVYLYGGLPMCNLIGSPGKITFKLELSNEAIVCVKYGQFGNTVLTTSFTDCDKNYGKLSAGTHNLELDVSSDKWAGRKGILWLKVNKTDSVEEITVNVSDIFIELEM